MRYLLASALIAIAACSSPTATAPIRGEIVFDGNSLLATEYGEATWVTMVVDSLHAPLVTTANIGVGGQTTAQMLSDVRHQTDPLFTTGEPDVYVAWEVTNDLYFGASADSAYARIVTLCQGQRESGWRVVVMTPMPRGNAVDPADWEARRQIVLTRMRQNWKSFADQIVDIAADPRMGSYASLDDKTLFRDRVHLGPEGTKIVAALTEPAVRKSLR